MKLYIIRKGERIVRVVADEYKGYLVWPNTRIPFLDRYVLDDHPERFRIEVLIKQADQGDSVALERLWQDSSILSLTLSPTRNVFQSVAA
ncbi:MAG: hypothetical protein ACOY3I_06135 [Verrucomicrobiota bacterium]